MARALARFAKPTSLDPEGAPSTIRTPTSVRAYEDAIPKTIDMPPATIVPRTTPIPHVPPATQRSSYPPAQPVVARPSHAPPRKRSAVALVVALVVALGFVALAAGLVVMASRH
jgi:hypothetical protein